MSNPNNPTSPWQMKIILRISGLPRDVIEDCKFRFGDSRDPRDDNAYRIVGAWSFGKGSDAPSVVKARQNGLKMIARRVLPILQQKKYKERVDRIWGTIDDGFRKVFIESIRERCDERSEPERSQIKNWDGKTLSDVLYLIPSVTNPSKEAPDDLIRQKKIMEEELRNIAKWKTDGNGTKHITIGNFEDFWNWMQIIFKESEVVKTKTGIAFDVRATPRGIKIIPSTGDKRDLSENDLRKLFQISKNFNDESMFELKHYEGSNFNASYYVPILKMYAEYWAETEESETEESEKVRKVGDKLEINGKIITAKTLVPLAIRFLKDAEWHTKEEFDEWLLKHFDITEEDSRNAMYDSRASVHSGTILYIKAAGAISIIRKVEWLEEKDKGSPPWRLNGFAQRNIVPLNDATIIAKLAELHISDDDEYTEMEDDIELDEPYEPIDTQKIMWEKYKMELSPDWKKIVGEIQEKLLIPDNTIYHIIDVLKTDHVLLEGPIGTGKTTLAKLLPKLFNNENYRYDVLTYTATTEWDTQDVIGGIVPKMRGNTPIYDINYGCVVETLRANIVNNEDTKPKMRYWTLIDEFSRAPIDKAFGPLFTALRDGNLRQIPTMKEHRTYDKMDIPPDYRIIGTLNSQDKSFLFTMSDALRSRFSSIEIPIPSLEDADTEIFFAVNNALNELHHKNNYSDLIIMDDATHKILNESGTDIQKEILKDLLHCYQILASVRLFHKLGTALLMKMYKTIITEKDFVINSSPDLKSSGLDNAITATLIPQLGGLTKPELGTIKALHTFGGVSKLFSIAHENRKKSNYEKPFEKVIDYLELGGKEELVKQFKSDNNFPQLQVIQAAHEKMSEKLFLFTAKDGIPKFIRRIEELEENALI